MNQPTLFTEIIDETEDESIPFRYEINSYGADYPVESLVRKIKKKTILIPPFQRLYIWNRREASKFIESLLLGLPVPGIFLTKESENRNLLILDGQQRLLTLYYFYSNSFKGESSFRLENVQADLLNLSYDELSQSDKNRLDDAIIHATVVKQDQPEGDDSSIYQIFERINSGGRALSPQEIRACIYYGEYNELLGELTENVYWRTIVSSGHNERLKEEELILRFFSLYTRKQEYKKPMKEFLNNQMNFNRNLERYTESVLTDIFDRTMKLIALAVRDKAFRLKRGIHSAVFDSVAVATAINYRHFKNESEEEIIEEFKVRYEALLKDEKYLQLTSSGTSDENNVEDRLRIAQKYLSGTHEI